LIGVLTLAFIVLKRQPLKGRTSNT
jgi:hypothetical protein